MICFGNGVVARIEGHLRRIGNKLSDLLDCARDIREELALLVELRAEDTSQEQENQETIMETLEEVLDEARAQTTKIDSVRAIIQRLASMSDPAKVHEILQQLAGNDAQLDEVIAANTEDEEPPVDGEPVDEEPPVDEPTDGEPVEGEVVDETPFG